MSDTLPPSDEPEPQAPARVVRALRNLRRETVFVPPQVDDQILARARQQLQPGSSSGSAATAPSSGWWPGLAIAAGLVALGVALALLPGNWLNNHPPMVAREDIDHNGTVDVLDAFALARLLARGQAEPNLDMNHDGVVNQSDVDAIAASAVKLNGKRS